MSKTQLIVGHQQKSKEKKLFNQFLATHGGGGNAFLPSILDERCQFLVSLPSITPDKKIELGDFLNNNEFSGLDTLMNGLLNTFSDDITAQWFIELIEYEIDQAPNLAYCTVNRYPIRFTII